mgnify:CR=1 FL=1
MRCPVAAMHLSALLVLAAVLAAHCACSERSTTAQSNTPATRAEEPAALASMPDGSAALVGKSDVDFAWAIKHALDATGLDSLRQRRDVLGALFDRPDMAAFKDADGLVSAEMLGKFLKKNVDGDVSLTAQGDSVRLVYDHKDADGCAHVETNIHMPGVDFAKLSKENYVMIVMPLFHVLFEKRIKDLSLDPPETK